MYSITSNSLASIVWSLRWQSAEAVHEERWLGRRVNFWRDIFPPRMKEALLGKTVGDRVAVEYAPGEALPPFRESSLRRLRPDQLRHISIAGRKVCLSQGRFYPRKLILCEPGVLPEDMRPFRLLEHAPDHSLADLNHPMAGKVCTLEAEIINASDKTGDTGGQLYDWMEAIVDYGPGMQARHEGRASVFYEHYPLERSDQETDGVFYKDPRLINHVDSQASALLAAEYGTLLAPGMKILDLMSSVHSHLPDTTDGAPEVHVTGLGMNQEELDANPRLQESLIHDLNQNPSLPFGDGHFDLVLCSLSVEYLADPLAVFAEARRVLRPGGRFVLGFSDRWFPTKVAGTWPDLHPFERMGLVLHWLLETGGFSGLQTLSCRNWWRPSDDPYYWQIRASDPVFFVSGAKT